MTHTASAKQMSYLEDLLDKAVAKIIDQAPAEHKRTMRNVGTALKADTLAAAEQDGNQASDLISAARAGFRVLAKEVVGEANWTAYVGGHQNDDDNDGPAVPGDAVEVIERGYDADGEKLERVIRGTLNNDGKSIITDEGKRYSIAGEVRRSG